MTIPEPILLTGAARSGTSMTAGIVNICGAFGGSMSGPTPNNKKGMFENAMVRNQIIKPYLKEMGCDPMGQNPLPETDKLKPFPRLGDFIRTVMLGQGYDSKSMWFYKGAKLCLIWPVVAEAFPKAKWIIVRRVDEDIVNSCMKTGFMRKCNGPAGWQSWVDVHKQRFQEMKDANLNIKEVWPTKFIEGDFSEIKSVVEWLGLTWRDKKVRQFITPELWGKRKKE